MDEIAAPAYAENMDASLFGWPWTGLVTLFTLLVLFVLAYNVGRARKRYDVPVPAMQGPDDFMRVMRAHANTCEQILLFLPLLWMAAFSVSDEVAALIGVFWPVSRILFAAGYYKEAGKRIPGFALGILVVVILFGINAVQMVRSLLAWQGGG